METAVFRCDFCGQKSEEEVMGWRRPRCSIEIILRGRRFSSRFDVHTSMTGFAQTPPTSNSVDSPPLLEDERWASTLCDKCMKRFAALFGLAIETPEETAIREAHLVERTAQQIAERDAQALGLRAEMVSHFPTIPSSSAAPAPSDGGLVEQFPTLAAQSWPAMDPNAHGSDAREARKTERRKRATKKSKRVSGEQSS
jgi:hypothetical protein